MRLISIAIGQTLNDRRDKWLADKRTCWLEGVLAEEHEREKKHPDRIELPD
jgi:hypothetical protein